MKIKIKHKIKQKKKENKTREASYMSKFLFASVNISSLDIYESFLIIDCTKCIPETYPNEHFYNF